MMPRLRPLGAAVLALLACALAPGAAAARSDAGGPVATAAQTPTITMSGSTSVTPLAERLRRGFQRAFPRVARIRQPTGGGSDAGINDVARGRVTIGMSSRECRTDGSDPGGLACIPIARDAVCIVTNPRNRLGGLNAAQVRAIFTGATRNWGEVSGASAEGTIDLVVRTDASGTQDAFQNIFLGGPNGPRPSRGAAQRESNGLVQASVRSNPSAIGYVDARFIAGLHTVPFEGVGCTLANARSGQYRGTRRLFFVTRGAPRGATLRFVTWVRSSRAARRIINSNWVPLR